MNVEVENGKAKQTTYVTGIIHHYFDKNNIGKTPPHYVLNCLKASEFNQLLHLHKNHLLLL